MILYYLQARQQNYSKMYLLHFYSIVVDITSNKDFKVHIILCQIDKTLGLLSDSALLFLTAFFAHPSFDRGSVRRAALVITAKPASCEIRDIIATALCKLNSDVLAIAFYTTDKCLSNIILYN